MPTARLSIGCPPGLKDSVMKALRDNPPLSPGGLEPIAMQLPARRGDALDIDLIYPDPEPPRPTIPELTARWLTEPTPRSREALWESLISGGYEFEKGAFVFQGRYFSAKRPALNHLNEYLISIF